MGSVYPEPRQTPSALPKWHSRGMSTRLVQGVSVPGFFYGTAWKEARTEDLARLALDSGFRAIDTANQRRHYVEAAVGTAASSVLSSGGLSRSDLFLQTKFTSL